MRLVIYCCSIIIVSIITDSLANSCFQFINMGDIKLQIQISFGGDIFHWEKKKSKKITVLMTLKRASNFINFDHCSTFKRLVPTAQKSWKLTFTSVLKITIPGFCEITNSNIYSIYFFPF